MVGDETPALTSPPAAPLAAHGLTIRASARLLVGDLDIAFRPGELVAILGRNGSGKTLTLNAFAGLDRPAGGEVLLDGATVRELGRRALARRLGILVQDREEGLPSTALESVLIGRHPHLRPLQWETDDDRRIARDCLERLDLGALAERSLDTLSGGEQQRVAIAALLAQDPAVFLLDEPTNHLDPHHQIAVLELFRGLAREGRTIVAILHDPTLAARFADRALLLHGDGRWCAGSVEEALTEDALSELYLTPMIELRGAGRRAFIGA
ncbi:MAG: ABC transporter ATP-binding protein [Steroidobacteraceae bacterium]